MIDKTWNPQTKIIKSGEGKDFSDVRIPGVPIFQTSNYLYENVEDGTDILLSKAPGHIYSRYGDQTIGIPKIQLPGKLPK